MVSIVVAVPAAAPFNLRHRLATLAQGDVEIVHRSGRWSGRASAAGIGAEADQGGGGFSIPPLPTFPFDSPALGGPFDGGPTLLADDEEFPEQPTARPTTNAALAANSIVRFIRSPRLVAEQRAVKCPAISHAGAVNVRVVLLRSADDRLANAMHRAIAVGEVHHTGMVAIESQKPTRRRRTGRVRRWHSVVVPPEAIAHPRDRIVRRRGAAVVRHAGDFAEHENVARSVGACNVLKRRLGALVERPHPLIPVVGAGIAGEAGIAGDADIVRQTGLIAAEIADEEVAESERRARGDIAAQMMRLVESE